MIDKENKNWHCSNCKAELMDDIAEENFKVKKVMFWEEK